MAKKEFQIDKFKSIDELYSYLDNNAFQLERFWDISDIWIKFRNQISDNEDKEKADWEVYCFNFSIHGSQVFSQITSVNSGNKILSYPDLDKLQKDLLAYVVNRAQVSINPILKARYYHLLWKGPAVIKNNQYAIKAIENYIFSIQEYCNLSRRNSNEELPFNIGRIFETLVEICDEIKMPAILLTQLKSLANQLIFKFPKFKFYIIRGMLDDMIKHPKIFKADDFKNTLTIFDKEVKKRVEKIDDFNLVHYDLPLAIKIASRLKTDVKKWHNEIGNAYLRLAAEEVEEDRFWIKQDYHFKAIEAFTLASNKEKKQEAQILYSDLKPKVKLNGFQIDFDAISPEISKIRQLEIEQLVKKILAKGSLETYRIISSGYFFPKHSEMKEPLENNENSFLQFCTSIQFDKNMNISKGSKKNDDNELFSYYGLGIGTTVLPYLHEIFLKGIESGILTFDNFISYLSQSTWIGKSNKNYLVDGRDNSMNWIGLLAPSIVEFFLQMQAWVNSRYYMPNFILCVDSLTLKMEGLFRDFFSRLNIPTSYNGKKGMQEVYIGDVIDNQNFEKLFNEDDRYFFKYLFSSDSGMNLRNNVAHSFYNFEDYHLGQMLLLIAALLRLAKYNIKSPAANG